MKLGSCTHKGEGQASSFLCINVCVLFIIVFPLTRDPHVGYILGGELLLKTGIRGDKLWNQLLYCLNRLDLQPQACCIRSNCCWGNWLEVRAVSSFLLALVKPAGGWASLSCSPWAVTGFQHHCTGRRVWQLTAPGLRPRAAPGSQCTCSSQPGTVIWWCCYSQSLLCAHLTVEQKTGHTLSLT